MKQCLFFDMDGTLIDSMYFWNNLKYEMLNSYFKRTGVKTEITDEDGKNLEGMSTKQAVKYFNEKYNIALSSELDIKRPLSEFYETECTVKKGVIEALEYFKSQGVRMFVMTATPRACAEVALKRLGLMKYFDFVLTPEDAKGGKTKRLIFAKACLKARCLPKNAVLVDDAAYAIVGARRAGFKTVAVYDKYRRDPAMKLGDLAFNDFFELLEHFKQHGKF